MHLLVYLLAYPFMRVLAWFPMPWLYFIGRSIYFTLYHVTGYRKELVWSNLQRSFPDLPEEKLLEIRRKYYRFLGDLFMETIKSMGPIDRSIDRRLQLYGYEPIEEDWAAGKNVMIVLGHYGNWEWGANALGRKFKGRVMAPYAPLKNPYFNKMMVNYRSRSGLSPVPKRKLFPVLDSTSGQQRILALIADQSPNPHRYYLVDFLQQPTAAVKGMESIARKYNYKVYFASTRLHRRGYYSATFELLSGNPSAEPEGAMTAAFMKRLEKDIVAYPNYYLWSHNRWKLTTNSKKPLQKSL